MSLWNGHSETNNGFHYLIAHALNSPIDSPHAPHGQASVNQGVAIFSDCAVTLSSTGAINRFKEMTPATSGVIARFPLLFPIRNSFELRGLYRRSYFGPRTCARKECAKLNIVCLSPEQFLCPTSPLSKLAATELPYHEMNPLTCLMSVTSVSTVPVDYQ